MSTSILDKMNLRPNERRLVVVVAVVVFVLVNFLFVWPHFGDVGRAQRHIIDTRNNLQRYQTEVDKKPSYERQLAKLRASGGYVLPEDQAVALQDKVQMEARRSGVTVTRYTPVESHSTQSTNQFFQEQSLGITVSTREKELVDFLYNLGTGNSMIRVRSMLMGTDPSHTRLMGSVTLVASYQKNPPPKPSPKPAAVTAPNTTTTATPPVTASNRPPAAASSHGRPVINRPQVRPNPSTQPRK